MKVWITKYALTEGIIEANAEILNPKAKIIYAIWNRGICDGNFYEGEFFPTKQSAIKKAEEMRQKEIDSLKKQIQKLEKMRFE